jgi:hypothetical protein
MRRTSFLWLFLFLIACGDPAGHEKPEDGLDAGREFIRAVLDGDYKKGELYILPEEEDQKLYRTYTDYMRKRPGKELIELKQASIIVNNVEELGDSVQIIHYSNSYSKRPTNVKVVRKNDRWYVDFSYTFSPNSSQDQ